MATNDTINKTNVSGLISPEVNTTINTIVNPKSFGDQLKATKLKNVAGLILLETGGTMADRLRNEIDVIISQKIKLEVDHKDKLLSLARKRDEEIITEEEYNRSIANEEINYKISKELYQKEQDELEKRLLNIIQDPYKKVKDKNKKLKTTLKNREHNSKKKDQISNDNRKKILKNSIKKTLVPVITLVATELLIRTIGQNRKLSDLVDETNEIIINADTPEKINQARLMRDGAINEINIVERNIIRLSSQLGRMRTYVTIFEAIVRVISLIPIPTSVPPGIGIPINVITKLSKTLESALKIVSGVSYVLAILQAILQAVIYDLEELKLKLLNINDLIDGKTAISLTSEEFTKVIESITTQQTPEFPEYNGFKFAIKEEQNPNFIVKGNKRHCAIAIDSDGVEVIKSEYSFTLDPQVLVDQLKLVIDSQNL